MLVDVTRYTRHNGKPLTAVKAARGLSLTKRCLEAAYGGKGLNSPTISKPPGPVKEAFAMGNSKPILLDVATTEWGRLRKAVFERDRFVCQWCGEPDLADPHCDHVIARSLGGLSTLDNLVTSYRPCNVSKGAKPLDIWRPENRQ